MGNLFKGLVAIGGLDHEKQYRVQASAYRCLNYRATQISSKTYQEGSIHFSQAKACILNSIKTGSGISGVVAGWFHPKNHYAPDGPHKIQSREPGLFGLTGASS